MGSGPIDYMGQLISHPITDMARPELVISVSGCHCWELYNSVIIHCFLPAAGVSGRSWYSIKGTAWNRKSLKYSANDAEFL